MQLEIINILHCTAQMITMMCKWHQAQHMHVYTFIYTHIIHQSRIVRLKKKKKKKKVPISINLTQFKVQACNKRVYWA